MKEDGTGQEERREVYNGKQKMRGDVHSGCRGQMGWSRNSEKMRVYEQQ